MKVLLLPPDNGGLLLAMPPLWGLLELPLVFEDAPPSKLAVTLSRRREQTYRDNWHLKGLHRLSVNVPGAGTLLEETVSVYEFGGLQLV